MDFMLELEKQNMNIRICSIKSGIPYGTLHPIIKGQVDIGTCSYYTVAKLAKTLGYRPDQIVYHNEDFQTFRNNLHHKIKGDELQTVLELIENDDISYYRLHSDYKKMLYLLATIDFISKKNDIPLCDKYDDLRKIKLEEPFYVGDSKYLKKQSNKAIPEFIQYNIYEGDLYDAV
ncbi:MAG: hypothetical protein MJ108_00830 [Saccharofermentans sp.]|nr:hypothetical protein [Saccharofermentans sp.]